MAMKAPRRKAAAYIGTAICPRKRFALCCKTRNRAIFAEK
jgi:hypothetical protein